MQDFSKFWNLLNNKNKSFFLLLIFLMFILAVFEVMSIAIVIPFVTLLLEPETLNSHKYFYLIIPFLEFGSTKNLIIGMSIIFFSLFLIKNIFILIVHRLLFNFVYEFRRNLSSKVLKKYLHQNYLFFINISYSKIASNLSNEVSNLSTNFLRPILIILSDILVLLSIIILVILSGYYKGAVIVIPFVILSWFFLKLLGKKVENWGNIRVINARNLTNIIYEIVLGVKEIFLSGKIKKILMQFNLLQKQSSRLESNFQWVQTFPKLALELFAISIFLLTLIYLTFLNLDNKEIIVILTFYFAVAYRVMPSFNKILIHYQQLKLGKPSLNIIINDLNLDDKIAYIDDIKSEKIIFDKEIEFSNINFHYKHRDSLFQNLNFSILKNQAIGIFGESGSGKTTILNIMSCLIKPNDFVVKIDGKPLKSKEDFRNYQNLISFVSQDTFLIKDTIKNNITLYKDEAKINDDQLLNSLKFARLNKFLEELPQGIETIIDTNSKEISSGQRQRIALARFFYNLRDILIFDEATNALDEDNEKAIIENILNLKTNKTIIIVSHNKNNLKNCDKIIEVKNNTLTIHK